jgi:hypothetical protein
MQIDNLKYFNGAIVSILINEEGEWTDENTTKCKITHAYINIDGGDIMLMFHLDELEPLKLSEDRNCDIFNSGLASIYVNFISFPNYSVLRQ